MGMYTQINVNLKIKRGLPTDVIYALKYMTSEKKSDAVDFLLPSHPLFKTERWTWLLQEGAMKGLSIISRNELKNYENEIELFFNWIKPYVKSCENNLMGSSLHEEDDDPKLYYLD